MGANAAHRVVAGYRLERQLGRGAAGEVWLGRHVVTGGVAAVKLMREAARPGGRRLFERERHAIARLSHPHIVSLYDRGPDFLVTAYVDGRDLLHRMRSPLTPQLAVRIAREIAGALEHAHQRGVVHRDVKPSNILVDEEDHAHLVDFGVARLLDDRSDRGTAGTPAFMAPEQTRGEPGTPASDQYALARTLLALLVGDRLPQDPAAALALLPSHLPAGLHDTLRRATDPDPGRRFPSMRELDDALAAVDLGTAALSVSLLPPRRAPPAWCARPAKVEREGDLERCDYRLSDVVSETQLAEIRTTRGYVDLGWAVFARGERLGGILDGSALARATEIVVIMHGMSATRDNWDAVARWICRDNGHTVVLVPDHSGFGESRFTAGVSDAQIAPAGILATIRAWLALLGLADVPTVLVGHSMGAIALLTASDRELGPAIHRVMVAPAFPSSDRLMRWRLRIWALGAWLCSFVPWLFPFATWVTFRLDGVMRELSDEQRALGMRLFRELGARNFGRMSSLCASARPAEDDRRERCAFVVAPNDAYAGPRVVARAMVDLHFPARKVQWLASGGHYPHLYRPRNPEQANRDRDELVGIIDSVLESTRSSTDDDGSETVLSRGAS